MQLNWDVIVVGAGPAGMACARECAVSGLNVLVLDRQGQAGGQIWKNAASASSEKLRFFGEEYKQGVQNIQAFLHCGATFIPNAHVWYVQDKHICVSIAEQSYYLNAKAVVLATGAMERPSPVQGWDLPNVMGVGACDLLLKSAGLSPSAPVALCGNGPLILQTVAHLCKLKIPISALVFTGNTTHNMLKAMVQSPKVLSRPIYFLHGFYYALQPLLKVIPTYFRAKNISITQDNDLQLNFETQGKQHNIDAKTILLHEGIISETRISHLANCRHVFDSKNLYWHAQTSEFGQSSEDNIYIAGDLGGVAGALSATAKGHIVGIAISAKLGKYTQEKRNKMTRAHQLTVMRCKLMQDFTDAMFSPNKHALVPSDDAIVCRCEELKAKELKDYILKGCYSLDALKAQSRCGMGHCQGRMCASSVAELIANAHAIPLENLNPYQARPPLFPISMGELADLSIPNVGL